MKRDEAKLPPSVIWGKQSKAWEETGAKVIKKAAEDYGVIYYIRGHNDRL